jgi:homopolymeric O-antigen transport system ATP-binding protein
MKPLALRVENLGKLYRVNPGRPYSRYRTLRESLQEWAGTPFRRSRTTEADDRTEEFWAIRDVGFEVGRGEVVGIIGRNGAGKSTFLKILSKITKPTTGRVELCGRVGSLLEVGTGFHPELTGRENIFLNGAILGMARREIAAKFDAIVAFAEVETFLDTPVKRYSSGMYVRLAFAVAAYLEPEILIVDEVLAVGDMAFQRKCMGRMRDVGGGGSTVLFVSHNMPAIEALCDRAVLLDAGHLVQDGEVQDVIAEYRRLVMLPQALDEAAPFERTRPHSRMRALRSATLLDGQGEPTNYVPLGGPFQVRIGLDVSNPIDFPTIGIGIDDTMGQRFLTLNTPLSRSAIARIEGRCAVDCRVEPFPLAPGDYMMKLSLSDLGGMVDSVERVIHFTVVNGEAFGEGRGFRRGLCVAPSAWTVQVHEDRTA